MVLSDICLLRLHIESKAIITENRLRVSIREGESRLKINFE